MSTSKVEDFLSAQEEQEIVAAILEAEKFTSGEIRVHIEAAASKDPYERAQEVFHVLKMGSSWSPRLHMLSQGWKHTRPHTAGNGLTSRFRS